jgi:uracil-DNA glycosylase
MAPNETLQSLIRAAKQVIETEQSLAGQVLPAKGTPLPVIERAVQPEQEPAAPVEAAEAPASAAVESRPPKLHSDPEVVARKAAALEAIAAEIRACCCCGLRAGCTNPVPGEGNPDARVMFIGEGPGADEDIQGRPFVGKAGQLLNKQIEAMGLKREDVFIANVVKCRPPDNRTPTPQEAAACWPFLRRQIEIVEPEVIVVLGNPAARALLNTTIGITRLRGQWQQYAGIPVMPTFHPAYVLRQYTVENRRRVWDDLKKVMARLGLEKKS